MDSLTISDLDADTLEALKAQAEQDGRTVSEEAADLIRRGLKRGWDPKALRAEAERIAAMTPKGVTQTDSTTLLREDRDR
jgi:antitoxin FitA